MVYDRVKKRVVYFFYLYYHCPAFIPSFWKSGKSIFIIATTSEMFFIRKLKPSLNVQTDAIKQTVTTTLKSFRLIFSLKCRYKFIQGELQLLWELRSSDAFVVNVIFSLFTLALGYKRKKGQLLYFFFRVFVWMNLKDQVTSDRYIL